MMSMIARSCLQPIPSRCGCFSPSHPTIMNIALFLELCQVFFGRDVFYALLSRHIPRVCYGRAYWWRWYGWPQQSGNKAEGTRFDAPSASEFMLRTSRFDRPIPGRLAGKPCFLLLTTALPIDIDAWESRRSPRPVKFPRWWCRKMTSNRKAWFVGFSVKANSLPGHLVGPSCLSRDIHRAVNQD
jgi:hypothetical protein